MLLEKALEHPRTLAAAAGEAVRRQVLTGQLVPGAKINQAILAEELGISVVPLREALRKLEAEGLVRILPHRGAYIAPITRDELADLYSIRGVLEGMATRAAVSRLTAEHFACLSGLIAQMEDNTAKENYQELLRLNRQFHLTIYEASGRPFLFDLIVSLWDKSLRYRSLYVHQPGRPAQALQEHKEILQALKHRRVKEAVRALRNNLRQTTIGLLATFKKAQDTEESLAETELPVGL